MVYTYNKNSNGEFVCSECKTFKTLNQSTMHYHIKNHEGSLNHECDECDMKFLQKSVLNLHKKSKHSEDKKNEFNCPSCSYNDLRKGNCIIHFARIHLKSITDKMKKKITSPEPVTQCTECSKTFKNMTGFYYHVSDCIKLGDDNPMKNEWKKLIA